MESALVLRDLTNNRPSYCYGDQSQEHKSQSQVHSRKAILTRNLLGNITSFDSTNTLFLCSFLPSQRIHKMHSTMQWSQFYTLKNVLTLIMLDELSPSYSVLLKEFVYASSFT